MSVEMLTHPKWGECRQETGRGVITEVKGTGRNRQVLIRATHANLQEAVTGWVDTDDGELAQRIEMGGELEYEILVHRRRNIAAKPFAELVAREKIRDVIKLAPVSLDDGERDQTPGSAEPHGRDDVQGGDTPIHSVLDSHVPAERDVPNTDDQRFESHGFTGNCGMTELAYQELHDAEESGALDTIPAALFDDVAHRLMNAADQVQRSLVGRTNRAAQSHVRARGAVRTALIKYPVAGGLGDLDAWSDDIAKMAARFLKVAASL